MEGGVKWWTAGSRAISQVRNGLSHCLVYTGSRRVSQPQTGHQGRGTVEGGDGEDRTVRECLPIASLSAVRVIRYSLSAAVEAISVVVAGRWWGEQGCRRGGDRPWQAARGSREDLDSLPVVSKTLWTLVIILTNSNMMSFIPLLLPVIDLFINLSYSFLSDPAVRSPSLTRHALPTPSRTPTPATEPPPPSSS